MARWRGSVPDLLIFVFTCSKLNRIRGLWKGIFIKRAIIGVALLHLQALSHLKCIKSSPSVTDLLIYIVVMCPHCSSSCTRFGKSATGNQRYRCKKCKKTHSQSYRYQAYKSGTDVSIKEHVKEGCGIRSIARLLKIATTTVLKRIVQISKAIMKPMIVFGKDYELDEMCTYVERKTNLRWIVYAIRKDNKEVVDFAVGCRTTKTLRLVTDTLILSNARMVYTDKLRQYGTLLPIDIHKTTQYGTNHIERKNLSLRTHIRRLGRRTICFSRSLGLLRACLAIYFWG